MVYHHQWRIVEANIPTITCRTSFGKLFFLDMSFGLTNAHGAFMDFMTLYSGS